MGKSGEVISQGAQILSKIDVVSDPGVHMSDLMTILSQRSLLSKLLAEVERIRITIPRLTAVLEKLAPLKAETITSCLRADSAKWEQLAT